MNDERRMVRLAVLACLAVLAPLSLVSCGGGVSAPRGGSGGGASAPRDTSAATLDGTDYALTGELTCAHTDSGSIYDAPAAMWHGTLNADGATVSYVNLTVWQLKRGGPAQFSIGLQVGGVFHHASTIKGATLVGSGTATVESGATTTLHATGTDEKGLAFDVTLRCTKVVQAVEDGGR